MFAFGTEGACRLACCQSFRLIYSLVGRMLLIRLVDSDLCPSRAFISSTDASNFETTPANNSTTRIDHRPYPPRWTQLRTVNARPSARTETAAR
jgi:hypothetical protein